MCTFVFHKTHALRIVERAATGQQRGQTVGEKTRFERGAEAELVRHSKRSRGNFLLFSCTVDCGFWCTRQRADRVVPERTCDCARRLCRGGDAPVSARFQFSTYAQASKSDRARASRFDGRPNWCGYVDAHLSRLSAFNSFTGKSSIIKRLSPVKPPVVAFQEQQIPTTSNVNAFMSHGWNGLGTVRVLDLEGDDGGLPLMECTCFWLCFAFAAILSSVFSFFHRLQSVFVFAARIDSILTLKRAELSTFVVDRLFER